MKKFNQNSGTGQIDLPTYEQSPLFLRDKNLALTPCERVLYSIIYYRLITYSLPNADKYSDENGDIFVLYTNDDLASDSGIKISTLKKVKKALADKGLISIVKIPNSRAVRIYLLYPEDANTYSFNANRSNKSNSGTFDTDQVWEAAIKKSLGKS